jgi:hypothetical protein
VDRAIDFPALQLETKLLLLFQWLIISFYNINYLIIITSIKKNKFLIISIMNQMSNWNLKINFNNFNNEVNQISN